MLRVDIIARAEDASKSSALWIALSLVRWIKHLSSRKQSGMLPSGRRWSEGSLKTMGERIVEEAMGKSQAKGTKRTGGKPYCRKAQKKPSVRAKHLERGDTHTDKGLCEVSRKKSLPLGEKLNGYKGRGGKAEGSRACRA